MTITLVGTSSIGVDSGNPAITLPAGIAFGDAVGVIGICSNAQTLTAPGGWSVRSGFPVDGGSARFYAWTKDAVTASDAGAVVTFTSSAGNKVCLVAFALHSGNGFPTDWTDDLTFQAHTVTGTTYTAAASVSTVANTWGVACFGLRGTGPTEWSPAAGLTERQDLARAGSGATSLHLCDSAGSVGGASTTWGPFTESNVSSSNGGGLTWLVKENATGGGGGGGGGGGLIYPKMGLWRDQSQLNPLETGSWRTKMNRAVALYGPFQGHWSRYHDPGTLPLAAETETAFRDGIDLHIFWKPYDAGAHWADTVAGGYDTEIDQVANDIINLVSGTGRKIWLTLHHEPENDTTGASGNFSYSNYRGMWQRVRSRFDSAGASQYVTWVCVFMNSHSNPSNNPIGPGQNMIQLWGNDGVMDGLVDVVSQQDYIVKDTPPSTIATKWIEDLEFLVTNSTANRNWSYLDKPQAFTEWGADLGGGDANRGTAAHRAQTIDAIRGILPDLASRNVVSITYFDARSDYIEDPPSVDGVAFQALKDASEAGQQTPPVSIAGVALANDGLTTTSTSIPFTLPAGWAQGDYALAFLESNGVPNISAAPAGWSLRDTEDTGAANGRAWVYEKVLQAGEANPTWTIDAAQRPSGVLLLIRGAHQTTPVHAVAALAATSPGTSHAAPAVTTTASQAFILTAWLVRWSDASGNGGSNYGAVPVGHTADGSVSVNSGASAGSGGLVGHLTASPVGAGTHGPYTATFPVSCTGLVTQLAILPAGVADPRQLADEAAGTDTLSVAQGAVPKTLTESGAAADSLSVAAAAAPAAVVPVTTVQVAFGSQPMAATPIWTTLPTEGTGAVQWPLVVTHGRGDEFTQPQPGTLAGRLRNEDGRYTMGKTGGPHGANVKVGRRVRVQHTYQGVVYPRFDGHQNSWPVDWPFGGGETAWADLVATDRLKRLGHPAGREGSGELRSMLEEETLRDAPAAYFPLSEPDGSTAAGSITTTTQAAAVDWPYGLGGGAVTFGQGTGPGIDGLPAAIFDPAGQESGRFLRANPVAVNASGGQVTLSCWFATTSAPLPNAQAMAALTTTAGDDAVVLAIWQTGQVQAFVLADGVAAFGNLSPATYNDGRTHHAAVTLTRSGSTVTVRLYVDGVLRQTGTFTHGPLGAYSQIDLGGFHVAANLAPYAGTLSHVAAFPTALSATRILTHYQAGATGLSGERTDQRIARIADWIGLPAADRLLDVGDKLMGPQATAGKQALEVMQEAAAVEQGVLFVDGAGRLTFHRLGRRYNRTSPDVTLDVAAGHVATPAGLPGDDFGMTNDMEVTRPGGATQRALNQTSIDEYGLYRDSLEAPTASDNDTHAIASWRADKYGTPRTRMPTLTVPLARLHELGLTSLVQQLLALEISSLVRLSNLPAQAPGTSLDVVVEGWTETIDPAGGWTLELNCSPADLYQVWDLGVTGFSELGVTTILAL